jgi:two-component system, cell cycle sensor histidine kinase and response regulator CckA
MLGAKMVLLVPDAATRDRARTVAALSQVDGLHVSTCPGNDSIDGSVRDMRRAQFDGPLAVLVRDHQELLLALEAGADEAAVLDRFAFDSESFVQLVQRTKQRSAARVEARPRLAAISELEKLCALGRLVSGVAEELSDPLNAALVSLELLQIELEPLYGVLGKLRELSALHERVDSKELAALIGRVRTNPATASRAQAMLADVSDACEAIAHVGRELGLAPDHEERPEPLDLRRMLDKVLRLFERAAGRGVHIERNYAADLPEVSASRARVAQTLVSLVSTALAAMRGVRGHGVHRLGISLRANDRAVMLSISGSGATLAAEVAERVLGPQGAPGKSGNQLVLGDASSAGIELQVARSTLRGLGGDLLVESLGGEHMTFVAWLPRTAESEMPTMQSGVLPRPEPLRAPDAARSVLVLEPDAQVLGALSRLLRERYAILLAQDGREAQNLLQKGLRPDAILADVDDPGGPKFVRWLFEERPELTRRLLLTSSDPELLDALASLPCVVKPLEPAALFRAIEERLSGQLRKVVAAEPKPRRAAR